MTMRPGHHRNYTTLTDVTTPNQLVQSSSENDIWYLS